MSDLVTAKAATLIPTGDVAEKRVVHAGDVVDLDALGTPQWFRDDIESDPWTSALFERVESPRPRVRGRQRPLDATPPVLLPQATPGEDPVEAAARALGAGGEQK